LHRPRGEGLLASQIISCVIEAFANIQPAPATPQPELDRLTARERDVSDLLILGHSNTQIAVERYVEPSTVKAYVAHTLAKLGLPEVQGDPIVPNDDAKVLVATHLTCPLGKAST
jgi:DNA-binding NarL/FixJ family response regulator